MELKAQRCILVLYSGRENILTSLYLSFLTSEVWKHQVDDWRLVKVLANVDEVTHDCLHQTPDNSLI